MISSYLWTGEMYSNGIHHYLTRHLPFLVAGFLSLWAWLVFQPGFMNADALVIYQQATAGIYDDWHPPIMAFILRLFLDVGLGIGMLMLLQSLWAFLGLCFMLRELSRLLLSDSEFTPGTITIIFLFICSPLFPFPFYAMAFLKDTWCALAFLWIVGISVLLWRKGKELNRVERLFLMFLLVVQVLIAILSRHNAVVLLPVFIVLLFYLSRTKLHLTKASVLIWCALPVALYFGFQYFAYEVVGVERREPERQVYAAELVGLAYLDSAKCSAMPYICNRLTENWRDAYTFGEVYPVMWWGWKHSLKMEAFDLSNPELASEYITALKSYPFSMMEVKSRAFAHMLRPSSGRYWFHRQLDENRFGLGLNDFFERFRTGWTKLTLFLTKFPPFRYLGAEHLTWLLVCIVLLVRNILRMPSGEVLPVLIILIPFVYYSTYFLAATGWDYRFMYPATLIIESITVLHGWSLLSRRIKQFRNAEGRGKDQAPGQPLGTS